MRRSLAAVAVVALASALLPCPALPPLAADDENEDELLPGEFRLTTAYRLIDARADGRWVTRRRIPTVREVVAEAKLERIEPLVILALHGDRNESNHYVPSFSADGRSLGFLTADIERRTAKVRIVPELADPKTVQLVFADTPDSYDYMLDWAPSPGASPAFVLASQRRRGVMDIYAAGVTLRDEPRPVAQGEADAIAKHPALAPSPPPLPGVERPPARVAFERGGRLFVGALPHPADPGSLLEPETPAPTELGPGLEPAWSPDGTALLYLRPSSARADARADLVVRTVAGGKEQVLYRAEAGERLRTPRFTPDGRHVLFHAAGTDAEDRGHAIRCLPVDPTTFEKAGEPRTLLEGVRAQPHFDWHPIAVTPDGRLVLAFAVESQGDGYYPIHWARIDGSARGTIDHSDEFTTAQDVAVDPDPRSTAVAFAAVESLAQGIYVVILNHHGEDDD